MSKIDGVFEWAKKQQITFVNDEKKTKTNNSHQTWDDYCDKIHTFENWCKKEFGTDNISKVKPWQTEAYLNHLCQQKSAFTAKAHIHALHAFKNLAVESKIYRYVDIGEKEVFMDRVLKHYDLVRKSGESKCLKATVNEYNKVMDEMSKSRSKQKNEVMDIHKMQRLIGCRIKEAVSMRKRDFTLNPNGSYTVYIKGKGGQERWVHVRDKEAVNFLSERLDNGKKAGAKIFSLKDKDGKEKSIQASVALVKDVINKAVTRAGVERKGARYSSHSGRKVYAQEKVNELARKSYSQLDRMMKDRIKHFPLDKNGRNKLQEKFNDERNRLREKIHLTIPGRRTKEQGEALRKAREMTHKELCLFLVSVDTGHFRINIMRYYCDYPGDLSGSDEK